MSALTLRLPIHPTTPGVVRSQLRRWLTRRGWPDEQADDLVLAANEAVSNAVEHAYVGSDASDDGHGIELTATDVPTSDGLCQVLVTVTDRGRWKLQPATSPSFRGRGLPMMRALTDRVEVSRAESGTRVSLTSRAVRIGRRVTSCVLLLLAAIMAPVVAW